MEFQRLVDGEGPDGEAGLKYPFEGYFAGGLSPLLSPSAECGVIPVAREKSRATGHFGSGAAQCFMRQGASQHLGVFQHLESGGGSVRSIRYAEAYLSMQEFPSNTTVCCVPSKVSTSPPSCLASAMPAWYGVAGS